MGKKKLHRNKIDAEQKSIARQIVDLLRELKKQYADGEEVPVTLAELQEVQNEIDKYWEEQVELASDRASNRACLFYQGVIYLSLCEEFHFKPAGIVRLQKAMDGIIAKVSAVDGEYENYCMASVRAELSEKYNITFDEKEAEKLETL